jgi:hypothetical protein
MLRLLKIVTLMLALAAFSVLNVSCGSSGDAQVRVINAIDTSPATNLDVYINGTIYFTNVAFDQVNPTQTTPAKYTGVPSGNVTVQAYPTGTTSNPIFKSGVSASLGGSTTYTMLLGGSTSSANVNLLTDNNTSPTNGNMEVRVINGAASTAPPGQGIGVAIYQRGQTVPPPTNVAFGQSTGYVNLPFEAQQTYLVEVFLGTSEELFTFAFIPGGSASAGQITTLAIIDNPGGFSINNTPLTMIDLN